MSKKNKSTTEDSTVKMDRKVLHEPDPSVDPEEYSLDRTVLNLVWSEPFFGTAISLIPRREDWKSSTAWIGVSKETREAMMGYNPDFMRSLPDRHKAGVLKHELLHWLFAHVTNRNTADSKRHQLWNVACDLAINSVLCAESTDRLPEFCLLPGRAPKTDDPALAELIKAMPQMQTADFYMEQLEQYAKENKKENEDGEYVLSLTDEGIDSHDGWQDIPEEIRDILREQANEILNRSIKEAQSRGWGSLPTPVQQHLISLTETKVDWRSVLKQFVGRCRSIESESTIKRLNKKMPYVFPGKKRNNVARLLWAVDQSGSMSDELVARGLGEAHGFSKLVEADMVNFDTEIDEKSFQTIKNGKLKWERTRCGGTDFNCVAEYVNHAKNRGRWTGVIILTDGYAPSLSRISGVKVLWLITPDGTMDAVRTGDLVIQMDKSIQAKIKR